MKKLLLFTTLVFIHVAIFAQKTYVYFQNNTALDFTVSSTQTGTHTMETSEWWSSTASINDWQKETNLLWTNRDAGVHWGDDFYFTTTLVNGTTSISLKLKLTGNFVGSTIYSAASGPGFSHGWTSDNNFHSQIFTIGAKQYELKYTFYFTGGYDDILYTLHEYNAFSANAAELSNPNIMNVLAYNTYMLSVPIAISDQGTRALHIDDAVNGLDALLIQEVFDNAARATFVAELADEYPYQTAVVDLPNILEDGGIMIASRWPIEYQAQMTWNNCNTPDCLANKGVMYARINKLGKKYHLFSTHQQAFNSNEDVAVRNLQMQQFNAFIDAQNIPANEAVIFGGDMNVDKHTNKLNEYNNMFDIFNATEPTYSGHPYSWDPITNHYLEVGGDGPEYLDYVLADNDYLIPVEQLNSTWILRSNHNDMWNIHDLSDHYAIHGRFVYTYPINPCDTTSIAIASIASDETSSGSNDGNIDISISGGMSPYTYSWSNGGTSEDISGLSAGQYVVTVTDANGCFASDSVTISVIPTCLPTTASFGTTNLTHTRAGSTSTSATLAIGSQDITFNITNINQKLSGQEASKYIEQVTVSYIDGNGNAQTYGSFSGANVASANVSISGFVKSITVTLKDIYDGDTRSVMAVTLSGINYCGAIPCADADNDGVCNAVDVCPSFNDALIGTACNDGNSCTVNDVYTSNCNCAGVIADADADGICDANDICPGGDDNIDLNNNGTPDFCEVESCISTTNTFNSSTLTHLGTGSNSTTLNLPNGSIDAAFTVNNINAVLSGKENKKYNERITITYVNGNGITQTYGTYTNAGTVNVSIAGAVQSITVSLTDAYDGNSAVLMSVNLSAVTTCSPPSARVVKEGLVENEISIFPNPTSNILFIKSMHVNEEKVFVNIFNLNGQEVFSNTMAAQENMQINVSDLYSGIYIIKIASENGDIQSFKFVKQ
jgi:endonuclease/exonuclease/phosphatase family metal-dependent hydrolase